jgi:hypothetical protein
MAIDTIHLEPQTINIPRATIQKKWKPLAPQSQERIRQIILNLRQRKVGANARMSGFSRVAVKKTKHSAEREEYAKVVEDIASKLLSRLPRMPFPPSSSTSTQSSTITDDFDLSYSLSRINTLQSQLSTNTNSTRLLQRQIRREKRALEKDRRELKMLREGLRGAQGVRKIKERGLHCVARAIGENDRVVEVRRMGEVAGIETDERAIGDAGVGTMMSEQDAKNNDPNYEKLVQQLQSHLLSMRNNTASMMPVLDAMENARTALDKYAGRTLGDEALRRLYGVA